MSADSTGVLKHHFDDIEQQRGAERLGMWMFLVTEVLFFGGVFAAYTMYRIWYPQDFAAASSKLNPLIAGINTLLLLTSSLTMTLAIRAAQLGNRSSLLRNLLLTAALGTGFMCFKAYEYSIDFEEQLVPGPSFIKHFEKEQAEGKWDKDVSPQRVQLFLVFYYSMTGIHSLHLIIGIGCVLWLASEAYRNKIPPEAYSTVEVISLYWHLVDMIWLFLMPLLYLAGPHSPSDFTLFPHH